MNEESDRKENIVLLRSRFVSKHKKILFHSSQTIAFQSTEQKSKREPKQID